MSLLLCGAVFNFLVAACMGGPMPSLPGVRWTLPGVRRVGVALPHSCGRVSSPSGACGSLLGSDQRLVSLALVLWCASVRRALSCHALLFCSVLGCGVLRCALLCRAVRRCVVPWCVMLWLGLLRRAVPRRVVSCCGVSCRGLPCHGVLQGGALPCDVPCCLVLCRVLPCRGVWWARSRVGSCRCWLDWPISPCGTQAEVMWLAGGSGAVLCVVWLVGSVLRGSGCAVPVVGSGGCPQGCPPWGPVPWSRALWGSLPLVLGVAAVSSSSSGGCVVPLLPPGFFPGSEGVVVGCSVAFSAAPSVIVAPSLHVGVPSFPCAGSSGRSVSAGAVCAAWGPCFGGASWRVCAAGGRAVSAGAGAVLVPPLWRGLPVCAPWCPSLAPLPLGHGPGSFPFLAGWWFHGPVLCRPRCLVHVGACPLPWASPCPLAGLSFPFPCLSLALALSLPGVVVVGWEGGGWSAATSGGLRGCGGGEGPGLRPGGGLSMLPAAWRPPGPPRWGWRVCGWVSLRRCAPCAPLLAFPLPRLASPSGKAPARRGQTTRRGRRGPGRGRAPSSRSWSGGGEGWGWRMRTGCAGTGKLGAVRGGNRTWTWDGSGGRGGTRGSGSGGGRGLGSEGAYRLRREREARCCSWEEGDAVMGRRCWALRRPGEQERQWRGHGLEDVYGRRGEQEARCYSWGEGDVDMRRRWLSWRHSGEQERREGGPVGSWRRLREQERRE